MAWNRMKAKEEFMRDADNALEQGIVAIASQNALGKWVVARYHNGEYNEKTMGTLPYQEQKKQKMAVSTFLWIILPFT